MRIPVPTWTEQGIPFTETRCRLPERGENECYLAFVFLLGENLLGPKQRRALTDLVTEKRSARLVLDQVERSARDYFRACLPEGASGTVLDSLMEVYGLAVEALVRKAYTLSESR